MRFPPNPHILYVDDNQDSCEMISLMLLMANSRYRVSAVTSPQKMLSLMAEKSFNLFILDYALPDISGVELCRRIRQSDATAPIIFYSGMAREAERRQTLQAGANEYLVKPNDLDKLTKTVDLLLTESNRESAAGKQNNQPFFAADEPQRLPLKNQNSLKIL